MRLKPEPRFSESGPQSMLRELYEWMETAVFTIGGMLLVFSLLVRPVMVDGSSMVPTLLDRQQLVLRQIGYHEPAYGDIVVVDTPQLAEKVIIKRVIGKAGDEIDIDFERCEVRRNGELLEEPYINEPTQVSFDVHFPVIVPEGHVFVMGDNRNHSKDSRSGDIGMVDLRQIMGKAVFRFLPLDQIGPI